MSALDQTRALLDQLMGTGRDGENNKFKVRFDDPRVCKSFLLGCCPHDILSSTRMDLGECPKIHDLALKADFEMASKRKDYFYDIDAMEHLQSFIADCDRRTELARRRLKETQEELSEEAAAKADVIHQLGEMIGTKLAKAEEVGAQGNVDESLKLMQDIEDLKKKKSSAEVEYRNSMPASSYQQQKLRVCEVCSAYLGIHDNDRRLADHFGGKLHLGFITIRQKLTELQNSVQERRLQREKEREERRAKEKEEEERRKRRSKSSERKRRSRSRSRSRDRKKRRSRSRSSSRKRSRRRRSRSRSKDRRSRGRRSESRRKSRSRSRSKKRSRRSRSRSKRSRSRTRRSRSRDRARRSRNRSRDRRSRDRSSKERSSRTRDKSRERSRDKSASREKSRERSKERNSDNENPTKTAEETALNGEENGVKQEPME